MVRYITLLLFFVFTISIPSHTQAQDQDFTHNIWPTNHFGFEPNQEVTPYESYLRIEFQSKASNRINNRSDFTHKLDSILFWSEEGSFEVITGKSEYIFQYGDELTDLRINYIEKENNAFSSFPTSFTITDYTKKNLIKKQSFTNKPISNDTFDHSTAITIREYMYNDNDQLILYEDQNQFAIINDRITNRKEYRYDSLGFATGISHYFWFTNDDTITHLRETIYKYNDLNQLESIVNRLFDFQNGWENEDSTSLYYNSEDQLVQQLFHLWVNDEGFRPWRNFFYDYYENGDLKEEIILNRYVPEDSIFKYKSIYESDYYDYGSLKKRASFDSLSFEMPKEDNQTWSYKHNEQIYSYQTMIPRYMNYEESRAHNEVFVLDEYESYSGLGNYSYLILESRQQYFYSEIDGVSTNDPIKANSKNLKVSPNPVIDNLRFEVLDYSGNVDIVAYDVNGHMVLKKEMFNKGDVDVSFLSSGVYFYTVRAGGKLLSGRFVKS